jgi:hypothetical protein
LFDCSCSQSFNNQPISIRVVHKWSIRVTHRQATPAAAARAGSFCNPDQAENIAQGDQCGRCAVQPTQRWLREGQKSRLRGLGGLRQDGVYRPADGAYSNPTAEVENVPLVPVELIHASAGANWQLAEQSYPRQFVSSIKPIKIVDIKWGANENHLYCRPKHPCGYWSAWFRQCRGRPKRQYVCGRRAARQIM